MPNSRSGVNSPRRAIPKASTSVFGREMRFDPSNVPHRNLTSLKHTRTGAATYEYAPHQDYDTYLKLVNQSLFSVESTQLRSARRGVGNSACQTSPVDFSIKQAICLVSRNCACLTGGYLPAARSAPPSASLKTSSIPRNFTEV